MNNLGVCLLETGKPQEALELIDLALSAFSVESEEIKPESGSEHIPSLHHNKAVALHALSKYEAAIQEFKKALQGGLDTPDLHNHYAMSLFQHGKKAYGIRHWKRAVDLATKELETKPEVVDDLMGYYNNLIGAYIAMSVS